MKIKVFSEDSVKHYKPTEPYMHIAISSQTKGLLQLPSNKFRRITLYCQFYDLDAALGNYKLFDKKEAKRILYWVNKYLDYVNVIVVNCEAGISRSSGVAAALSKILNGDDNYYFKNYCPNMLVYRTILNEYYGEDFNDFNERKVPGDIDINFF